jgi:hypothetical protein
LIEKQRKKKKKKDRILTDGETNKHAYNGIYKQTNIQIEKQTNSTTEKQTNKQKRIDKQ